MCNDTSYQSKIECPINLDIECLGDCENCNYHKFFKDQDNDTSCQTKIDELYDRFIENTFGSVDARISYIHHDWLQGAQDFRDFVINSSHTKVINEDE